MLRLALVLLACALFVSPATAANTTGAVSELNLIFHGSVQGEIEDCGCKGKPLGGLARRAAILESTRAECGPQDCTLVIDCGSLLGRTDAKGQAQSAFVVEETAKLGYEAVGVGAWDLRHGVEHLREVEAAGIHYTNANLLDAASGEPAFTPYRVREVNGVRVGMISVASQEGLVGIDLDGLKLLSPREALQRSLPEMREECDLVVLMAQMKSQELRELLSDLNANPLTAVDIAVEGMGTRRYSRPTQLGETWLLAANNRGKVLGQAKLIVAEGGEILDLDLEIQELRLDLPEEPALAARVKVFQDSQVKVAGTE